jgi:uncharacterized protein
MSVRTKAEVLALLQEHQTQLNKFGVRSCALFGSFVRDEQDAESDIDILVSFKPGEKSFDNFMGLSFFLEDLFGRDVQIVTPESLSPHIGPHILAEVEYAPINL